MMLQTIFRNIFLLAIVLLLQLTSYAQAPVTKQDKQEMSRLNEIFGEDDPDFAITAVPDKWKNESAVILCQKHTYVFDRTGAHVTDKEVIRRRIKLQDKAAVDEFSEFYFISTKDIGVQIVKANGKLINVDVRNAVEVSADVTVPTIFRSNYSFKLTYRKLAISDLEPGDIIDYFHKVEDFRYVKLEPGLIIDFYPIIMSLNSVYPIVKQKLLFEAEKGFYISERSTNGAPQLKEVMLEKRGVKQFSLVDADRDKLDDEKWFYTYRSTPTIKFEVIYPRYHLDKEDGFFSYVPGVLKTSVTPQEVMDVVNAKVKQITAHDYNVTFNESSIMDYLNKNYKKETDPQKIVQAIYYYYRYYFYSNSSNATVSSTGVLLNAVDDELFTRVLARILQKKKIDFKVMAAVPKTLGTLDDLIFRSELFWFIKVEGNKPMYIYPVHKYANITDKNYLYEGVDAYEVTVNPSSKKQAVRRVTAPASTFDQNSHAETIDVTIDDDMELLTLAKSYKLNGHSKTNYYGYIFLETESSNSDQQALNIPSRKMSKKEQETYKSEYNTKFEKEKKARLDILKEVASEDFEVESYDDFKLVQDGRAYDKQELIFNEKFKVKDLIKKAGGNYLLDVGKLIGGQIVIKEDEMKRKYDIYMSYPHTINYTITIAIPTGYAVSGLDKLKAKVDNETGTFICAASVEGNTLKINIQKTYKESYEKKEKWKLMVDFLDACYDFTQAKVVLKKKK